MGLLSWFKHRLLKKPLLSLTLALIAVFTSVLLYRTAVRALNRAWIQTDWSGGADTGATADDTNLTNWTKYYSGTSGVDTSVTGEAKLKLEVTTP